MLVFRVATKVIRSCFRPSAVKWDRYRVGQAEASLELHTIGDIAEMDGLSVNRGVTSRRSSL